MNYSVRKTASGKWTTSVYIGTDPEGKKHYRTCTAATRKECLTKAAELRLTSAARPLSHKTVGELVGAYVASREPIVSPTTYTGYEKDYRVNVEGTCIASVKLPFLDRAKLQLWVDELRSRLSPKSILNAYGLVKAALRSQNVPVPTGVRLPRRRARRAFSPSTGDICRLLLDARESDPDLYRAILLAAFGTLRRGECVGLRVCDLDRERNTIHVCRVQVRTRDGSYVYKDPKTELSDRIIAMPHFVMDALPDKDPIIGCSVDVLTGRFQRLCKTNGVSGIRFHDLRHYSVSILKTIGISDMTLMSRGGWSNPDVMQKHYIGLIDTEEQRETKRIMQFFDQIAEGLA